MKKEITKKKIVFSLSPYIIDFLENNFENKSRYVEHLIHKNFKKNGIIKNDIII